MIAPAALNQIIKDIRDITGSSMRILRKEKAADVNDGCFCFELPDGSSVLETSGPNAEMAGQLLLRELEHIETLTKPRKDKTLFLQDVISGRVAPESLASAARKRHLDFNMSRAVLLAEVPEEDMDLALQITSAIISKVFGNHHFAVSGTRFVVVRELADGETVIGLAQILADTLRSEILTPVRVSCGAPAAHLGELTRAYSEAVTALSVSSVFTPDNYVISYEKLGLGRLIYTLDPDLCRSFLTETFGKHNPLGDLDADSLTLINYFFSHNLNITDTAKALYLHRNTLIYRLEKIRDLTGFDIRRFDDAMTFRIAMLVNNRLIHLP
ncbi:MAG: helix-turn-helix domain-containing protein [Eubacterium sp.]|nr:helix-turn-helix domain-containing protein [Eubacterium sp.]